MTRLRRLRARARALLRQWRRAQARACRLPDSALRLDPTPGPFFAAVYRADRLYARWERAAAAWRAARKWEDAWRAMLAWDDERARIVPTGWWEASAEPPPQPDPHE